MPSHAIPLYWCCFKLLAVGIRWHQTAQVSEYHKGRKKALTEYLEKLFKWIGQHYTESLCAHICGMLSFQEMHNVSNGNSQYGWEMMGAQDTAVAQVRSINNPVLPWGCIFSLTHHFSSCALSILQLDIVYSLFLSAQQSHTVKSYCASKIVSVLFQNKIDQNVKGILEEAFKCSNVFPASLAFLRQNILFR